MYADEILPSNLTDFHPIYMSEMEPIAHIANYRGLPKPFREISLDEFLWISTGWSPTAYDFLQVLLPDEKWVRNGWGYKEIVGMIWEYGIVTDAIWPYERETLDKEMDELYTDLGGES